MIIQLPNKDFYLAKKDDKKYIYINRGIMYIKGVWNYEKIMKLLFIAINSSDVCFYCYKKINAKNRSIDHLFPRAFGGVSIPENMALACVSCNNEKREMDHHQYNRWLKLKENERKEFYLKVIKKQTDKYQNPFYYNLPPNWVERVEIDSVFPALPKVENESYIKDLVFIRTNGKLKRPLVLSKNGFILDGMNSFYAALELGFKKVPAVVLENVIFAK